MSSGRTFIPMILTQTELKQLKSPIGFNHSKSNNVGGYPVQGYFNGGGNDNNNNAINSSTGWVQSDHVVWGRP
jgi:hypothetical protein